MPAWNNSDNYKTVTLNTVYSKFSETVYIISILYNHTYSQLHFASMKHHLSINDIQEVCRLHFYG